MPATGVGVRAEQIYDALLDDECLRELPAILAEAYGARSCTLHWRHEDGGAEILSHSGYFSDEHMLSYVENFTEADLWTLRASERSQLNRVWNCDELVPHSLYEKSVFYNDWIRAIGDDTYFCMGTVMQTQWGQGIIGLHRGKAQPTFEKVRLRALEADVLHLRRMLAMRGKLAAKTRQAEAVGAAMNTLGDAVIVVTAAGRALHLNQAAERILKRADGMRLRGGVLIACSCQADAQLRTALALAADPHRPKAAALALPRRGGGQYELSLAGTTFGQARHVVITARDPDAKDGSLESRLRDLYRLSPVEAKLAVRLAEGATVAQAAQERQVAVATVQAQLKSLAAKLNCHRQVEIVKIVAALPRIRD